MDFADIYIHLPFFDVKRHIVDDVWRIQVASARLCCSECTS